MLSKVIKLQFYNWNIIFMCGSFCVQTLRRREWEWSWQSLTHQALETRLTMRTGMLQIWHPCSDYINKGSSVFDWIVTLFSTLFPLSYISCSITLYLIKLSHASFSTSVLLPLFLFSVPLFPFLLLPLQSLNLSFTAGSPSWSSLMTSMRHTYRRRSTLTERKGSQTPESTAAFTSFPQLDIGEDAVKDSWHTSVLCL